MSTFLSGPRKASYALFALALIVVARFNLGPCVLAGLVSFMIMDLTERGLRRRGAKIRVARWAALAMFAVMAVALSWIFIAFVRVGVARLPVLLDTVLPRLTTLSTEWGYELPVDNALELRDLLVTSAKENFASVTKTSGLLTRGFFLVLVGVFAAAMRFLTPHEEGGGANLYEALREEFSARVRLFVRSFELVVGAQVAISTVNTILTAVFLYAMGFPFKTFLILTAFVCGLVPIVGNVISNVAIVTAGLTVSVHLATFGLAYLVVIHKLEYILNSRIIGGSIDTPMWMTLLGLVAGEALMGVPGILLAPALLHYARAELRDLPVPATT
ncbi:MAG: AI-2E family transporter [Elusimicrobia bacterium]|nr:AI-2E family transporter [Elusimicrobiota bacterium]